MEFVDDLIAITHTAAELEEILQDIHNASKPVGLNMHLGKTKVMFNKHATKSTITVDGRAIEEVESYIYLGRTLTNDGEILTDIRRRIALGWAAFGKVDNIMKSTKDIMKIKR